MTKEGRVISQLEKICIIGVDVPLDDSFNSSHPPFIPSPPPPLITTIQPSSSSLSHTVFLTVMQQAIPYRSSSWRPLLPHHAHFSPITHNFNNNSSSSSSSASVSGLARGSSEGMVKNMVSENAVIVFARRGCCMSHVVKRLLLGLGVNPAVYEVDEEHEVGVVRELEEIGDGNVQFPAVFIGGKLFGGLDRLMATHISGELVPILKDAGALWL